MRVPLRQVCVAAMMGVLSLFVAPAPAHAWWDFIEEFSGHESSKARTFNYGCFA